MRYLPFVEHPFANVFTFFYTKHRDTILQSFLISFIQSIDCNRKNAQRTLFEKKKKNRLQKFNESPDFPLPRLVKGHLCVCVDAKTNKRNELEG